MKIAIYGDSFAVNSKDTQRKSWVDYLSEHYDIKNYAVVGSSLVYSMENFYRYQNNYQLNIFLVTSFGRLWVPNTESIPSGLAGLSAVKYHLNTCVNEHDLQILRAAHDYYVYIENRQHQVLMHKAMVKDLMSYENTIIIPCFKHGSYVPNWQGSSMMDIADLDLKYYSIDYFTRDKKPCHLNDQNNKIFATKIHQYIKSPKLKPFYINVHDYVYPVGEPIEYNYGEKTNIDL